MENRVIFYLSNDVHILDLAGPLQVFYESGEYGIPYEILFVSDQDKKQFSSGLFSDKLIHFSEITLLSGDILIIPGFSIQSNSETSADFDNWLKKQLKTRLPCAQYAQEYLPLPGQVYLMDLNAPLTGNTSKACRRVSPG